jgi:hypothetical protein
MSFFGTSEFMENFPSFEQKMARQNTALESPRRVCYSLIASAARQPFGRDDRGFRSLFASSEPIAAPFARLIAFGTGRDPVCACCRHVWHDRWLHSSFNYVVLLVRFRRAVFPSADTLLLLPHRTLLFMTIGAVSMNVTVSFWCSTQPPAARHRA